jgi:large conductance mechanosensitive channel
MNEQERRDGLADQIDDRIREYRDFAFKDDMLKMAIAFILGGAFSKTVNAISESLIMPLLNFILQLTGENWRTATWEPIEGLVFEVGKFAAASVDFLLISLVLFAMWKAASRLRATSASHTSS